MPARPFQLDLAAYGPTAPAQVAPSRAAAEEYCRQFALSHYENFTVASWFLPKALRQHFCHIYAYCRWADDLADEVATPEQSLELLAWWEEELNACYAGQARHPVFVALAMTIAEFNIPIEPFRNLLIAFRQDQSQTTYATYEELLRYCDHSANPVGELVLYLGRCHNGLTVPLSNAICTGLQLANHWQDVARDHACGRVYLPTTDQRQFNIGDAQLNERPASLDFCRLLKLEVDRAEALLTSGWPLVTLVSREVKLPVELFVRGGLATLQAIRDQNYDVLTQRPTLSKWRKLKLLGQAWWSQRFGRRRPESSA
ncbi:MAG TPA: squalene synthase HpnC [Pirellulaceae bacterium]|nr:squalene synthase HpnC [Pirellulaceae bacterium]